MNNDTLPRDWSRGNSIIKVIGIGGGGCNAVNYMYNQGIDGCSFVVCNTDSQALEKSNVPANIQLGQAGLGAGTNPTEGRNAALDSQEAIEEKALDGTQMLFIAAGMGGGTGTGASPVIAKMAKDKGILTVAVVTLPFSNEGNETQSKAVDGIRELEKNVDSLLIINNEKLYEYFGDKLIHEAFPKADDVLATAVRGIIEVISKPGYINVDFKDVTNMMRDSGMALMGCGIGKGSNRIEDAVKGAFESPLLNDFDLKTAKNVLINITTANTQQGITMADMSQINDMISKYTGNAKNFKRGIIYDEELGDEIRITAIATGFDMEKLGDITDVNLGNIIPIDSHFRYDEETASERDEAPNTGIRTDYVDIVKFSPTENLMRFNYAEKPVLCIGPDENRAELENTTAIRRSHKE